MAKLHASSGSWKRWFDDNKPNWAASNRSVRQKNARSVPEIWTRQQAELYCFLWCRKATAAHFSHTVVCGCSGADRSRACPAEAEWAARATAQTARGGGTASSWAGSARGGGRASCAHHRTVSIERVGSAGGRGRASCAPPHGKYRTSEHSAGGRGRASCAP